MVAKYKTGDRVRIINYGHIIWSNLTGVMVEHDIQPHLVGKEAVVQYSVITQGIPKYSLDLFAWADESQLEKIE